MSHVPHSFLNVSQPEQRVEQLEKENIELRAGLALYENPHTPSSQRRFPQKKPEHKSNGKPGQKKCLKLTAAGLVLTAVLFLFRMLG